MFKYLYQNNLLSFSLFHANSRLQVFALRSYGWRLNFSMKLDGWNDIQSVKSAWSLCTQSLKPEFKHISGNNRYKTNAHTCLSLYFQMVNFIMFYCYFILDWVIFQQRWILPILPTGSLVSYYFRFLLLSDSISSLW